MFLPMGIIMRVACSMTLVKMLGLLKGMGIARREPNYQGENRNGEKNRLHFT